MTAAKATKEYQTATLEYAAKLEALQKVVDPLRQQVLQRQMQILRAWANCFERERDVEQATA